MKTRFENFTRDITAIYRLVQKIKHVEMTQFDLKGMHVMCLYFLAGSDGLTAAQLSGLCFEDKAAISRSIATLKEKGFVYESQTDGQKKYRSIIKLTEQGARVAALEGKKIENAIEAGGRGLTDEERESFYKSLSLISSNLDRYFKTLSEDKNEPD